MYFFFFFNDTATTEIYTLSLHDALPISLLATWLYGCSYLHRPSPRPRVTRSPQPVGDPSPTEVVGGKDRKSTRLNSSHANISYAVFCLKKKNDVHRDCGSTISRRHRRSR